MSWRVGDVTQRSLTKQLREMEADGIVQRKIYAVVPPRVDYNLTDKGQQLRGAIEALHAWGQKYRRS